CKIARTGNENKPVFEDAKNNNLKLIEGTNGDGPYGTADPSVTLSPNTDILGVLRSTLPDMGAYESAAE
ncbi:MAG: hypothetical protein ACOVRN_18035, partial [Flavobacterium sp.]